MALHWQESGCIDPTRCDYADINWSSQVDSNDLFFLADNWLKELCSLDISSTTGGVVSYPGEELFTYSCGYTEYPIAEPNSGYHFINWTGTAVDAGKVSSSTSSTPSVIVDGEYTLQANFTNTVHIHGRVVDLHTSLPDNGLVGATIYFSNNAGSVNITDHATGQYVHSVPYGWSGTATPDYLDWEFGPESRVYSSLSTDQYNQDYFGLPPTQTGQIHGERSYSGIPIPDNGDPSFIALNISGAPSNAIITNVRVYYEIDHTTVSDLVVWVQARNGGGNLDREYVWTRDYQPFPNLRETVANIHRWDDASPNQTWYLYAEDEVFFPFNSGSMIHFELWIDYESIPLP